MDTLTPQGWAVVAILCGCGVFSSLYILSSILRDASRRVELYRRVAELREVYAEQMRELEARGFRAKPRGQVIEVGDAPGIPQRKAA